MNEAQKARNSKGARYLILTPPVNNGAEQEDKKNRPRGEAERNGGEIVKLTHLEFPFFWMECQRKRGKGRQGKEARGYGNGNQSRQRQADGWK